MKYITLKRPYTITQKNQITKYMTPKYIYLPFHLKEQEIKKANVKKEEQIAENMISPVSGRILGTESRTIANGTKQQCLIIENNYKETLAKKNYVRKNITTLTKQELITELEEWNRFSLSKKFWGSKKTLICNTIEEEPYEENETLISIQFTNQLLETLDALRIIGDFHVVRIITQNNNRTLIEAFTNFLGTYPNMELSFLPNYYLLEREEFLKQYLHDDNVTILKPSEIYQIFNIIKRRKQLTEHIFTISGNAIKNPQVIETKIGTSLSEIKKKWLEIEADSIVYVNGLMKGRNFNIQKLIVTEELKSIFFMKEEPIKEEKCMNCGKCYQICPVGCNPRAYLKNRKKQEIEKCIDCGLCSYICPSYINLRKKIKGESYE